MTETDYARLVAELNLIKNDPAMRPMSPGQSAVTTLGGLATGFALTTLGHWYSLLLWLAAAVLLVPLLARARRRSRIRKQLDEMKERIRDAIARAYLGEESQ